MNKNIRWWEYVHNGWVKLTLKPGQTIHHHYSAPDDEGYSFTTANWAYLDDEEPMLLRQITTGGRDCDGYISSACESFCSLDELSVCPAFREINPKYRWEMWSEMERNSHNGRLIHRPAWREGKSSVYDQEAQRANY